MFTNIHHCGFDAHKMLLVILLAISSAILSKIKPHLLQVAEEVSAPFISRVSMLNFFGGIS